MIALLDKDFNGTMGFPEFKQIWEALEGWKVGERSHAILFPGPGSGGTFPRAASAHHLALLLVFTSFPLPQTPRLSIV